MPKVRIYKPKSDTEAALRKLLEQAGCPAEYNEEIEEPALEGEPLIAVSTADEPVDEDDELPGDGNTCDPEILVIVLSDDVCSSDTLDDDLKKAVNGGCRVVGVWPKGANDDAPLPAAIKKYGASEVPWNADDLGDVICGGKKIHKRPSGAVRTAVETERNCC